MPPPVPWCLPRPLAWCHSSSQDMWWFPLPMPWALAWCPYSCQDTSWAIAHTMKCATTPANVPWPKPRHMTHSTTHAMTHVIARVMTCAMSHAKTCDTCHRPLPQPLAWCHSLCQDMWCVSSFVPWCVPWAPCHGGMARAKTHDAWHHSCHNTCNDLWHGARGYSRTHDPCHDVCHNPLWTRIFHTLSHSSVRLTFISEKLVLEKLSHHLFYFILKGKIKQERNP